MFCEGNQMSKSEELYGFRLNNETPVADSYTNEGIFT